ncbi:MAG: cobalamin-dependent protein [Candidatus Electronema sp. V4]|uniref:cobalamin-dependent protein n=1 Tax=Candidatus Electronema sp. V4 TaxID=3454756 RepID=UPI0040558552
MKITLINPSFTFFRRSEKILSNCLGLLYIASYLQSKDHDVFFIDSLQLGFNTEKSLSDGRIKVGLSDKDICDMIPQYVELIGISVPFSHMAPDVHILIKEIKRRFLDIPVVIGGVYPSAQPKLAVTSGADFVVLGEGEYSMELIIEYINNDLQGILSPSIIYKNNLLAS